MAITTVSDAVVLPQAKGTGLSSEDDAIDAAGAALLASHLGGEYVGYGLEFQNHDATNDTVDIAPGFCYVLDDSTSTAGSRSAGGDAQVQSTNSSGYDTPIPGPQVYVVLIPSAVTVSCSADSLNQVWVNVANVSQNNAVEIRTDGGGGTTAEPSSTYIKLGETNPDDFSQDVRSNDVPQLDADADTVDGYQGSDLAKVSRFPLPNSDLQNDSVTVAGNSISLGGSSSIPHADISSVGAEDHHSRIQVSDSGTPVMTQPTDINLATNLSVTNDGDGTLTVDASGDGTGSYTDEQAQDAVGTILTTDLTYDDAAPSIGLAADSVTVAGNTVSLGSSTNVSHADLSAIGLEDHHNQIQFSDSGTPKMTQPTDVNLGSNLSVADDGDNTITVNASSSGGSASVLVAAPGEVQTTLDNAGSWETVRLQAGETYSISSTWDIPQSIVFDCNWATLEPSSDVPLIDMGMTTEVKNVNVDLRPITYTSNVIQWIAQGSDYFGPHNPANLNNLRIKGTNGEGTALYFSQRGNNGHFVSLQHITNVNIDGIGTGIEFDGGTSSQGHLNSMQISTVSMEDYDRAIDMHGQGDMVANLFTDIHLQPTSSSNYGWKILAEDPNGKAIHNNMFVGENWDQTLYNNYEFEVQTANGGIGTRNHMLTHNGAESSSTVNSHDSTNSVVQWHTLLDGIGVS